MQQPTNGGNLTLHIAICDDRKDELLQITEFTKEYVAKRGISADIRQFSHPDALLTACETVSFHIFLLDIVMPMPSGLDLAHKIRLANTDAQMFL